MTGHIIGMRVEPVEEQHSTGRSAPQVRHVCNAPQPQKVARDTPYRSSRETLGMQDVEILKSHCNASFRHCFHRCQPSLRRPQRHSVVIPFVPRLP